VLPRQICQYGWNSSGVRYGKSLLRQAVASAVLYIVVITPRAASPCIHSRALLLRIAKVTFARDLFVAAQCRASRNFGEPAQLSPASFAEPAASGRASRDAISASAAELSQWSSQLQPPASPTCCSSLFSPGTVTVSFQTESSARCAAVQCRQ